MNDDSKKALVAETLVGLPEVPADPAATQIGLDQVPASPSLVAPTAPQLPPVAEREGTTAPGVPMPAPPPRRQSRLAVPAALPATDETAALGPVTEAPTNPRVTEPPPRRPSRIAVAAAEQPTNPRIALPERRPSRIATPAAKAEEAPPSGPESAADEPFEWTLPRVAAIASGVAVLLVAGWLALPVLFSVEKPSPAVAAPRPRLPEPSPAPRPAPSPPQPAQPVVAAPVVTASDRPSLALDSRTHVVDPFGLHAPDLTLDASHKYRLRLERDDARLGRVLVRLDEGQGWGVVHKLASHAALQFGGAQQLRIHCEPGRDFPETATFPLELVDLATKKRVEFQVFPARHCWDLEVMRTLELGDGIRHRVRVPLEAKLQLGENVPLKVAWITESHDGSRAYRSGVLGPGESVLVEGRRARFALLDPYAGDNEGKLELELHEPDTAADGLADPSKKSGARFVPVGGQPGTP
jgi:hypothetical protein